MTQEINRRLHEALGKCCRHEWFYWSAAELHTYDGEYKCSKCHARKRDVNYPDYCADPRLVIEAMRERGDFNAFTRWQGFCDSHIRPRYWVPIDLIMDKTGKLALLAIKFLKERKGNET